MEEWTTSEVCVWLENQNPEFQQYHDQFIENVVDGSLLLTLTSLDLKQELDVRNLKHRKQIIGARDMFLCGNSTVKPNSSPSTPVRSTASSPALQDLNRNSSDELVFSPSKKRVISKSASQTPRSSFTSAYQRVVIKDDPLSNHNILRLIYSFFDVKEAQKYIVNKASQIAASRCTYFDWEPCFMPSEWLQSSDKSRALLDHCVRKLHCLEKLKITIPSVGRKLLPKPIRCLAEVIIINAKHMTKLKHLIINVHLKSESSHHDLYTAFACLITAQKNNISTISFDVARMSDLAVFSRCVLPSLESMELRFDMFQTEEDISLDHVCWENVPKLRNLSLADTGCSVSNECVERILNATEFEYLKLGECFWSEETANRMLRAGQNIKSLQLLGTISSTFRESLVASFLKVEFLSVRFNTSKYDSSVRNLLDGLGSRLKYLYLNPHGSLSEITKMFEDIPKKCPHLIAVSVGDDYVLREIWTHVNGRALLVPESLMKLTAVFRMGFKKASKVVNDTMSKVNNRA